MKLKQIIKKIPGFRSGKPWKMVVATFVYMIILISLILPSDETKVSVANTENSTSESTTLESTTVESTTNLDWGKIIEDTKTDLTNPEYYSFVNDIDIQVNEDEKKITFSVIVGDSTEPNVALDFADTIIRRFNLSAFSYDSNIKLGTKEYYGSLYDDYDILIGVAPLSEVDDTKKWFVFDGISKGMHTKTPLKLQKFYR